MYFNVFQLSRKKKFVLFFSFLFAIAQATGYFLDSVNPINDWSVLDFFLWVTLILCILIITYTIILHICTIFDVKCFKVFQFSDYKKYYIFSFIIIIFSYILIWLAYYPGILNYDPIQIDNFLNKEFHSDQPLLHTLYLGFLYIIGNNFANHNISLVLNCFVQIIMLSLIFSYICVFVLKTTKSMIFYYFSVIFYAFFPFNPLLAISTTKDIIFTGLVLIVILLFYRILEKTIKINIKQFFTLIFLCLLMLLFRINAFISWIFFLIIIILLALFNNNILKIVEINVFVLILYLLVNSALINILNSASVSIFHCLSIPSVQIGRLYYMDIVDQDDRNLIKKIFRVDDGVYNQYLADGVSDCFYIEKYSLFEILYTCFRMFLLYPKASLDSILYLHKGTYYLLDKSHSQVYGFGMLNMQGYLPTNTFIEYDIYPNSKIKFLKNIMEHLYSNNEYQKNPFLLILFSPAFYNWLLIGAFFILVYKRDTNKLASFSFLLTIILTNIFGPCTIVRYYFPIMTSIPLIYASIFKIDK